MLAMKARGAEVFDYGNNIRACAEEAGVREAPSTSPASCPRTSGRSSAWARGRSAGSRSRGDPADIAVTDDAVLAAVPNDPDLRRWIDARAASA